MIKGESLVVKGIWIKRNSQEDLCTRYADPYKFRVRTDLLIPTGYAGLVNHSATPNLKKVVVGKKLYLRALRTIVAGEELSFTYSRYAQGQFKQPRND